MGRNIKVNRRTLRPRVACLPRSEERAIANTVRWTEPSRWEKKKLDVQSVVQYSCSMYCSVYLPR